jgi:hypothetical protein
MRVCRQIVSELEDDNPLKKSLEFNLAHGFELYLPGITTPTTRTDLVGR